MAGDPTGSVTDAVFAEEMDRWERGLLGDESSSLVDLINRVLDKGVVLTGEVTISVAGVDLVYLGLNAVLTSVSTARRRALEGAGERAIERERTEGG